LQVISENILSIDEVPDTEIPLRTAVTKATGGHAKQVYRTRFIYYCMTSRGDIENCTVLFFCFNCIMMQPDEQPDMHMHLTYPWP
ncbi:hypothetical protein T03_2071, partial [Trichinella britovi]